MTTMLEKAAKAIVDKNGVVADMERVARNLSENRRGVWSNGVAADKIASWAAALRQGGTILAEKPGDTT